MTVKQAYKILKHHAEWRQGHESQMISPAELTKALEIVLTYLENKLMKESHATI
jgi:hypothetical protein